MLVFIEKLVGFKVFNHLGPNNSFEHLDDVGGEGDRPVIGRVVPVTFLVDRYNRLLLVRSRYDA